jgi:hypothetical protein
MGFPHSLKPPEMSRRNYCEYTNGSQNFVLAANLEYSS